MLAMVALCTVVMLKVSLRRVEAANDRLFRNRVDEQLTYLPREQEARLGAVRQKAADFASRPQVQAALEGRETARLYRLARQQLQRMLAEEFQKLAEEMEAEENGQTPRAMAISMRGWFDQIAKQLDIPIYGIGAGNLVNGQLVIMHDLMGFYQPFRPWFAKCYIPEVIKEFEKYIAGIPDTRYVGREERKDGLLVLAEMAVKHYIEDVKAKRFPGEDYSYPIKKEELKQLKKSKMWEE